MIRTRPSFLIVSLALAASFAPAPASAGRIIFDDRPILVEPAPLPVPRQCPTCYKGHDFGRDCFQNVWNGFTNVWTNVCILGWL